MEKNIILIRQSLVKKHPGFCLHLTRGDTIAIVHGEDQNGKYKSGTFRGHLYDRNCDLILTSTDPSLFRKELEKRDQLKT